MLISFVKLRLTHKNQMQLNSGKSVTFKLEKAYGKEVTWRLNV